MGGWERGARGGEGRSEAELLHSGDGAHHLFQPTPTTATRPGVVNPLTSS